MGKMYLIAIYVAYLTATTVTEEQKSISVSADAKTGLSVAPETPVKREDREKRSDDVGPLETVVMQQAQDLLSLKATVQKMRSQLDSLSNTKATLKSDHIRMIINVSLLGKGSTFVRWGKSQCPSGTTTVYTGYAGGGNHRDPGAGANRICLTSQPVHDDTVLLSGGHGTVYGSQYYISAHSLYADVMCSLCHTAFSASFMVPGTNRCPSGTTEQYHGYLSVGNYGSASASEFLCLDANPDDRVGSNANENGAWFDHTAIVCGSLPCPPYVNGKAVMCVVCSK